jgi:uncharacterized membrane protein
MTRSLYHLIVRMHPPAFRGRFGNEMLSIFDEAGVRNSSAALLFDGLISFSRQWVLRSGSWKLPVAVGGAFVQVFGFAMPIKGHQSWTENQQALTPLMRELVLFALALICTLIVLIMSMLVWNAAFQRRRSAIPRNRFAKPSGVRSFSSLHRRK